MADTPRPLSAASQAAIARYQAAAHAVQSAVAFQLGRGGDMQAGSSHKHLRVGVTMAMVEHGALGLLLIRKGVITEEEYYEAIADHLERELETTTLRIRRETGLPGLTFR